MASNGEVKSINPKAHKSKGIINFFKEIKAEFKRFTWPTKDDIKKATMAVITFCIIFVIITGLLDKGFKSLFDLIFFK